MCIQYCYLQTLSTGGIEDGLITQFFGENKDKKLTVKEFRNFHEALRMEVLQLEVHALYIVHSISRDSIQ